MKMPTEPQYEDPNAGTIFQSILTDIDYAKGAKTRSKFVCQLFRLMGSDPKNHSLSMKFNLDIVREGQNIAKSGSGRITGKIPEIRYSQ